MSPKLLRPVVDVEFLPDAATPGEWSLSVSADLPSDPIVEDLPLIPNRGGASDTEGVDAPERADIIDSLRTTDGPGEPKGALVRARMDCVGLGNGDVLLLLSGSNLIEAGGGRSRLGDIDVRPAVDARGVLEVLLRPDSTG